MKKLLLFALAAGIGVSAYAQNRLEVCTTKPHRNDYVNIHATKAATPVKHKLKEVQVPNPKGNRDIQQVKIGMSGPYGVYSVLIGEQRPLSFVPGLDLVSFTHRGEENEHPGTDNSTIVGSWSNNISSFDNHIVLAESAGQRHRYPSGQLFNPAGNNDPNQAYLVGVGPSISASGSTWDQNFFASSKLDGSANNLETIAYVNPHPSGSELLREGLSVADNGDVLISTATYDANADLLPVDKYTLVSFAGTKSGDTWTWTRHAQSIDVAKSSDGICNASLQEGEVGVAYSSDGSIGYKWAVVQKAGTENVSGIQPVIFYTEDAGATWTEIEYGSFVNNPIMSQYLLGINGDGTGDVWPRFVGGAGVVDANGDLQMFSQVRSSASSHVDSIWGYYYKSAIYNITFDKTSVKQVLYVDSIVGVKNPNKKDAAQYCFGGETGWQHRIQATVSEDGMYVGVSWGDTPNAQTDFEGFNASPDIKGSGRQINNSDFYRNGTEPNSGVPNFTVNDIYTGTYRFSYAAPVGKKIMYQDAPHLLVPMTTSISLTEFESAADDSPSITHSLLTMTDDSKGTLPGIAVPVAEGVEEMVAAASTFTVSQNQPNPFTGTTTITVNSNTVAPVSVEVSNIMGQTVFTQNEGTVNGSKQITIDASDLQAGIYFYTVTVGSESQTKKMMVK